MMCRPPTATDPGTGFTPFDANGKPTAYYGLEMTLKNGDSQANLSSVGSRTQPAGRERQS
jgi:hypothetical protein